ncbi:MAG: radical SAM family heme chaperone HemW, partial [Clostridia bacterium]|nr:radical SAM family heme chaperone HemW [Clostridia bacterium]
FCIRKCPYCDFYSFSAQEKDKDSYLKAVLLCLKNKAYLVSDEVDTIYFGGGTPSVFGAERISEVIRCIKDNYRLTPSAEITVECNPSSVTEDFMHLIKASGVNRVSMGMQSAVENERKALGRLSGKEQVAKAVSFAKKAGIDNISLDIMLGVPSQTMESLDESIDFLISSEIKHISAYMLKIEEGTPFHKAAGSLNLPDEDTVCDMYLHTAERLCESGFSHYEISNFALSGYESRHNLKYWHCEEYLGIGPSAHSFLGGKRYYYSRDFDAFIKGEDMIYDCDGGSEEEYIMLALRLSEGLKFGEYKRKFGKEIDERIIKKAEKFEPTGLLTATDEGIALTAEGFLLSNTIIGELIL